MAGALPFAADEDHDLEIAVVDVGVARAFWEGVPAARLLARVRLDRDQRDFVGIHERASGLDLESSTWDKLMVRLLAEDAEAEGRVKRAVARQGWAASDKGPLVADDAAVAALVHALLSAADTEGDSSPSEGAADGIALAPAVLRSCGGLDPRLGDPEVDRRAAAFEACLRLATLAVAPYVTSVAVLRELGEGALTPASLYPWDDTEVPFADRHALRLDRPIVEASTRLRRELAALAAHHGSLLVYVKLEPRTTTSDHSFPAILWLPTDLGAVDAAPRLAAALERGATTAPRVRSVVLRGGDAALDAIGAEMLEVGAHPFASAVFADILGRASRGRDVVRLVSFFAIAPDAATAAHALAVCTAPEVGTVLAAWLDSLAKEDASRLASCIEALAPYPHLHALAKPLLGG